MRNLWITLLLGLSSAAAVSAQQKAATVPRPDLSLTAIGRQHHPIHASNKLAQDYFDQGLTLIYGFNHEEAARAFRYAAQLDPASPMPLWGVALAVGPNYNSNVDAEREKLAFAAIQQAEKLAANAPAIERDYVAALADRYSGGGNPDYQALAQNYAKSMAKLSQSYPDDLDAATLYAESLMDLNPWKLWTHDGQPALGTEEIVRTLESVLARDPQHVGANHFYIHAVESSPNPSRGLASATRLTTLVPQAGHLVHMPSHIYIRTGDFAAAVKTNEIAARVDRVYAQKAEQDGSVYDLMYHSHNEHFLAMAASMEGSYATAKAAADALARRLTPHMATMPMLDYFVLTPILIDTRFNKWGAVLARPEPANEQLIGHAIWHYSRALAFAAQGDVEKAAKEKEEFAAEAKNFPADAGFGDQNKVADVLPVVAEVMEARLAAARHDQHAAIAHWTMAVDKQDALNYAEPPDWYYPVRESLGGALLLGGNPVGAEQIFRADLQRNPRNPRSLFGLLESLKAQKRSADAAWVQVQFESAWKNADTQLTVSGL